MKVCHVLAGYFPGYPAPYEYARRLTEFGVPVDVVALGHPEEASEERIDGVNVFRIPLGRSARRSACGSRTLAMAVLKTLRGRRYDLAHVYPFRGCSLLPLAGRDLADHWLLDIRSGSVAANRFRAGLANRVTALESRAFDWHVALDEQVGRSLLGTKRPFSIIPLGTDTNKFHPERAGQVRERLGLTRAQTIVVYSGSLDSRRRPERIIKGFARIADRYPDLRMLIVGHGDTLAGLRALAISLGVDRNVVFTGQVHYDQIQDYVADSDIGLAWVPMTPQYDHQPPLKTMEFLACRLATLATRTRGNLRFVRDGENALLIDDTPEGVASGVSRLMEQPDLRRSLRAEARQTVQGYDWRLIVRDRLLPLYLKIVDGK